MEWLEPLRTNLEGLVTITEFVLEAISVLCVIAGMETKPSFTPVLSIAMLLMLVGVVTLVAIVAQLLATTT